MLGIPKAFVIATIVYIVTCICRTLAKNRDDDDLGGCFISILGIVSAAIMAYSGVTWLIGLIS